MTRKCKTPAKVKAIMDFHVQQIEWITETLRVKRTVPIENQADHVKKSEDYWLGLAHGYNAMLESVLHEHNCYVGFVYVGATAVGFDGCEPFIPMVGVDHPEYASWRVRYLERT